MNELEVYEFKIEIPDNQKMSVSAGSVFHGALMETIDTGYAEFLHTMTMRPYSQCLYFDKNAKVWKWRVCTMSKEAGNEILGVLKEKASIFVSHRNTEFGLKEAKNIFSSSYEELVDKHFQSESSDRYFEYKFVTPCSFKTEGTYAIFPQPQHVLGSLINKWNIASGVYELYEKNILADLTGEVFVADYNLRMQPFHLEGSRIPAFLGTYTFGVKGNRMADRIIALLAEFAQVSGIGIKTALGMGAVSGFNPRKTFRVFSDK